MWQCLCRFEFKLKQLNAKREREREIEREKKNQQTDTNTNKKDRQQHRFNRLFVRHVFGKQHVRDKNVYLYVRRLSSCLSVRLSVCFNHLLKCVQEKFFTI